MSSHMMRPQGTRGLEIISAQNATITHANGTAIDFGGANQGVAIVGHNHPRVVAAIKEQADQLLHIPQTFENPARTEFLDKLHGHLPRELAKSFLCNSGTEAVEASIKLAMAATGRSQMVAAKGCFHGRTMGSLSLMDRPPYRAPFEGRLAQTSHVQFNDHDALHAAITNETAAFIVEPVQGEGGATAATPEFLATARDLCTDRGALLVFDEVQTGMGRTGPMLGAQGYNVIPDIVALGKGLAGGLPIGVASATEEVADALPAGTHGTTYGGNPFVCAAGAVTQDILRDEQLFERSTRLGNEIRQQITQWDAPVIKEIRGRGMLIGMELRVRAAPYVQQLQEAGVLALTAGPRVLRFLAPLTIPEEVLQDGLATTKRIICGETA